MVVFAVVIKEDIPTILGYCINEFGHRDDVQRALLEYYAGKISNKPREWVFKSHLVVIDDNTRISLICVPNFLTDFRDNPIFFFSDNKIKIVQAIKYRSDFDVIYADGSRKIIDPKGVKTADFKLKEKMFAFRYPHLTLECVMYDSPSKTWMTYDEYREAVKERKKNAKKTTKNKTTTRKKSIRKKKK